MKRSGKFYRKNEEEVMRSLGFIPTPNSGSGWVSKEDGENDHMLCQLKSTDADSIRIQKKDLHTLEYHASISHKMPVFAIQFFQGNEVWLMVRPDDLGALKTLTEPLQVKVDSSLPDCFEPGEWDLAPCGKKNPAVCVVSSPEARQEFMEEVLKGYEKKGRDARCR